MAVSDLPRLLLCVFDVVPAPTALSRRLTEYLKGLSERYQVVVLSVKTPDHTHIERYHGARLLRVPVGSGDLASRVQSFERAVRRQMESEEYVMVHSFDPFGGYALCERRSELGYKVVYDACSLPSVDLPFFYSEEEANRRFIARVRRQELFCLMNADVVIVANELTRDFVVGLGLAREQVQVLPAPVDLTPYKPEVMGVPDATPMKMVHLGHQGDAQDLPTLMEAMQLALQTVDVRLAVVGPKHDAHQARLEEQVAALHLTGKVEFQPPVAHDDLYKVLATADVGLLTLSDVERNSRVGSPLARLGEYLAAGRPVIAADVPAARALLPEDGVLLYRPQDAVSLADAIVQLANDPARRVKMGVAARAASIERDSAKVRADLFAVYVALSGTGVRAVGDADDANPDEVTQLGRSATEEDTQKKKKKSDRRPREAPSGTNKVKTDPNIAADETSPEAAMASRPPVMGTPLREESPPIVTGEDLQALAAELGHVTTEPNALRPSEPAVVMGLPLRPPPEEAAVTVGIAPTESRLLDEPPGDRSPTPAAELPPVLVDEAFAAEAVTFERTLRGPNLDAPKERTTRGPRFTDDPTPDAAPPMESSPTTLEFETNVAPPAPSAPTDPGLEDESVTAKVSPPRRAPAAPPTLDFVPLGIALDEPLTAPLERTLRGASFSKPAPAVEEEAPFVDDAELTSTSTSSSNLPVVAGEEEAPFADDADLAPAEKSDDEAPFIDDEDLRPVTGLTPALGVRPASPIKPPELPFRSTSGTFAVIASTPSAPPMTSSPSRAEGFVPLLTPPALPTSSPSRVGPPPLPRSTSGVFAVVSSTPSATGLFPEPPKVPPRPVVAPPPPKPAPPVPSLVDEPEEPLAMAPEEMVMTVDTDSALPASAIDPWLAQLVHGYCPPASGFFERHAPPTTMPGRDT
ncbi:MAG: hypothetical protein DI536_11315 [Archangium gephyra]|uniref:Glycosyltransferase subfamily 4-like N-terminal domain-containing protein n=1 Tax=Archangium gephyra TaxID=48 RepID=A0A2W5TGN0_9BACT|nr:MAG: hypothetical protein DI536_11315 [Archangium gephyra]